MTTTFKQFDEEQKVLEAVEQSGLMEELELADGGEWSNALSADELLSSLGLNNEV